MNCTQLLLLKTSCYMPPETQSTSDLIHDIMKGRKKIRDNDCIDVDADAEGCHSGSCAANPRIEGASDTWDGSSTCWHR